VDVNVLIALLDAAHQHHTRATQWLRQKTAYPLTPIGPCLYKFLIRMQQN